MGFVSRLVTPLIPDGGKAAAAAETGCTDRGRQIQTRGTYCPSGMVMMEPVGCAFAGIVLSQALAQAVGLDAHNRVGVLIEGGPRWKTSTPTEYSLIWPDSPAKSFSHK
jgi:hypothetical protein